MELHAQIACSLPDKEEIIEAGDLAELVYYRAILRCRAELTDGVILRAKLTRWFDGVRGKPAAHLDRLVAVGLLKPHERGWQFPPDVWSKWNPSKAEVEAKRAEETARKAEYRAARKAERARAVP